MLGGSAGKVLLNGSDAMIGGIHDLTLAHVLDPYASSWSLLPTVLRWCSLRSLHYNGACNSVRTGVAEWYWGSSVLE